MSRRAFAVAFIVGTLVGSLGQGAWAAGSKRSSLQPILEILDKAKLSGSLEFSGRCDLRDFPNFPQFRTPASSSALPPVQTLREVFGHDPAMQTTQDRDGTIRMIESGVPTDLLNVRISHISFEGHGAAQSGAYTPNDALMRAILRAPEVVDFMKAHNIEWPFAAGAISGNGGQWPPELPHISGSWDNLTLSEALDRVLKTFPGTWLYQDCPRSDKKNRSVYFRFFYLRNIGSGVFVEG
jgi:hypothetical protein